MLGSLALEERAPDLHGEEAGQERLQHRRPARLEDVLGHDEPALGGLLLLLARLGLERQEPDEHDLLRDGAAEIVVEQVDRVELVLLVGLDQVVRDLPRLRIREASEEPEVVLAQAEAALLREIASPPSDGGELDPLQPAALLGHEPLTAADDVRIEAAGQAAI